MPAINVSTVFIILALTVVIGNIGNVIKDLRAGNWVTWGFTILGLLYAPRVIINLVIATYQQGLLVPETPSVYLGLLLGLVLNTALEKFLWR